MLVTAWPVGLCLPQTHRAPLPSIITAVNPFFLLSKVMHSRKFPNSCVCIFEPLCHVKTYNFNHFFYMHPCHPCISHKDVLKQRTWDAQLFTWNISVMLAAQLGWQRRPVGWFTSSEMSQQQMWWITMKFCANIHHHSPVMYRDPLVAQQLLHGLIWNLYTLMVPRVWNLMIFAIPQLLSGQNLYLSS